MYLEPKDKKMKKLSFVITILTMILLLFGGITVYTLKNIEIESRTLTIESRIEEYKVKIQQSINSDLETLISMAAFFSEQENLKDKEFLQQFIYANNRNVFERMTYTSIDGSAIRIFKGKQIVNL